MQQERPLWLENWRFPSSNRSSVRILANIPAPKRFFTGGANDDGAMAADSRDAVASVDGGGNDHHQQNGNSGGGGGAGGGDINAANSVLSNSAVIFYLYNIPITGEKLTYASIILLITVLLISTSVLTISVIITSDTCRDVIGYYLVSLAVTDLLCGTLVTPLSVYAALDDNWSFSNSQVLCKAEAYVEVMLWTSTAYVFMWIGVDRYAALTRPNRYEIEQTPTRCKCWIIFTWITSALLCCPTLFGELKQAKYYKDSFLCVLDWGAVAPYSITLGVLVVTPSLISVFYTYSFIFKNLKNPENLEDNQKALLENDPAYIMTFFVILAFTVSWAPYFALRAFETFVDAEIRSRPLQFTLIWLAIGGGNWKFFIYCIMNPDFRMGLRNLCRYLCCNRCFSEKPRSQYSKLNHERQRFL